MVNEPSVFELLRFDCIIMLMHMLMEAFSARTSYSVVLVLLQSNLNSSNTDGSFTMANSNSVLSPYKILPIDQENKYLREAFLFHYEIVCCVNSLESPLRGDSNEYTQQTIIV